MDFENSDKKNTPSDDEYFGIPEPGLFALGGLKNFKLPKNIDIDVDVDVDVKVEDITGEDFTFVDPDEMIAKTLEVKNEKLDEPEITTRTSESDLLLENCNNQITSADDFSQNIKPDTPDENDNTRSPINIDDMKFLTPDEMLLKVVGNKLSKTTAEAEKKDDLSIMPVFRSIPKPDEAEGVETAKRERKPKSHVPTEAPILDKLAALAPSSLTDEEVSTEVFIPLDLGPLLKKKDIESPLELISPDEIAAEEEFTSRSLAKDYLLKHRYKILKVVSEKQDRTSYLVRDMIKEKKFVVKEIYSDEFSGEDLENRRDKFLDSIRIINTFKHRNLAEVYLGFTDEDREYCVMEQIEGVDLQKLSNMNTKPFTEKEVVKWGLELCDAVEFLHYRPTPFTLGHIEPGSIMVNAEGTLKITNYDLQRFFEPGRTLEFMPDDPKHLYEDITNLARVFLFLLTKQKYTDNTLEIQWPENVSKEMQKLLETACCEGQKTFGDIREFRGKFIKTQVRQKEEELEYKRTHREFPIHKLDFSWLNHWRKAIVSQKPIMLVTELLFLLALIIIPVSSYVSEKKYIRPAGALVYVSDINELHVINFDGFIKVHNINFSETISCIYPMTLMLQDSRSLKKELKNVLLLGYLNSSKIDIVDTKTLTILHTIPAAAGIIRIVPGNEDNLVYTLSKSSAQINVINLDTLRSERVFPAGTEPSDMLLISSAGDNPGQGNEASVSLLAVPDYANGRIIFIDPGKGTVNHFLDIKSSIISMALSPDKRYIFAVDTDSVVHKIEIGDLSLLESWEMEEGTISDIVIDESNEKIWIALKDKNKLQAISLAGKPGEMTSFIGASPLKMMLDETSRTIWVLNQRSKDITIVDADTGRITRRISLYKTPASISIEPGS
jgi:hypothetical protein